MRGEYFTNCAANSEGRTLAFARIDPVVHFDFGKSSPEFDKLKTPEIAANLARLGHRHRDGALRLHRSHRAFDAALGQRHEEAADRQGGQVGQRHGVSRLHLSPGRPGLSVAPRILRGSVGVRKDPKDKLAQAKTTMSLEWKPPRRSAEVIPQRNLIPDVVGTSFALVDRVAAGRSQRRRTHAARRFPRHGCRRPPTAPSRRRAYVAAHLADAERRARTLRPIARNCCRIIASSSAELPFAGRSRRSKESCIIDRQFEAAKDPETAVKRVVLLVMHSPRFLYREMAAASVDGAPEMMSTISPRASRSGYGTRCPMRN